jgi:hypothetical protein
VANDKWKRKECQTFFNPYYSGIILRLTNRKGQNKNIISVQTKLCIIHSRIIMKHKKQKQLPDNTILQRKYVRFADRDFLQVWFKQHAKQKIKDRWFCCSDDIPENLATAQGYGYKSLSAFFKALAYHKCVYAHSFSLKDRMDKKYQERRMDMIGFKD